MRKPHLRATAIFALAFAGLVAGPGHLSAQEEHEEEAAAAGHEAAGEHQEHAEHAEHGENEIAVFLGGTRRLKFEDDETGFTVGLEYAREVAERTSASIVVEWASGNIERDWVALLNVGIQPLDGWAEPLTFYVGAGIEVGRIDEVLLEEDEHGGDGGGGGEVEAPEEPVTEGEDHIETEVDALMRLGTGWPVHMGSFSIVPQVNFDLVGEDWSIVGGVAVGYSF